MSELTAESLSQLMNLEPHIEGGRYVQTYRSSLNLNLEGYESARAASSAIYYLFTPNGHSRMHQVKTDEIFHFYSGDPLEMLLLHPDGRSEILELSANFLDGGRPQILIPAGVWQGTRLKSGGKFALIGATVAPGFEFADYQEGLRADLLGKYPLERERITALTLE